MTIYEMKLLMDLYCLASPLEGRTEIILYDTLRMFKSDGLIDKVDSPKVTKKGECYILALEATPLPVCVWRLGDVETEA